MEIRNMSLEGYREYVEENEAWKSAECFNCRSPRDVVNGYWPIYWLDVCVGDAWPFCSVFCLLEHYYKHARPDLVPLAPLPVDVDFSCPTR